MQVVRVTSFFSRDAQEIPPVQFQFLLLLRRNNVNIKIIRMLTLEWRRIKNFCYNNAIVDLSKSHLLDIYDLILDFILWDVRFRSANQLEWLFSYIKIMCFNIKLQVFCLLF